MTPKKTLVLGASSKPEQYSNMAVRNLLSAGHPVEAIGRDVFTIGPVIVKSNPEPLTDIHTVTMYLNASRQAEYQDYILSLHPKRIIFNPGAENPSFSDKAQQQGIEVLDACTLVMLSVGTY
jgi:predicted CoA-binding protein